MVVDIYRYFKDSPQFKNKLIGSDYLMVEYKCPIDVEKFQLWTEHHMITYVLSGRKDWYSPERTYEIEGGDALFVRKGVYSTRQHFEVDYCVMLFFITDEFIKNFLSENNSLPIPAPKDEEHEHIYKIDVNDSFEALILSIFNYFNQRSDIPRSLVEIKFKELLFNILLNPKNKALGSYLATVNQTAKSSLNDVMLKNFQYDLKMEDYARLTGRSLSTFKRDFQKYYKQSPGKWLNEKRLEYAKSLLLGSDMNVSEVCYESGFKNSSHFNRAFKEKYDLPPNQFRLQFSKV